MKSRCRKLENPKATRYIGEMYMYKILEKCMYVVYMGEMVVKKMKNAEEDENTSVFRVRKLEI
jgi:hypothetical protein